MPSSRYDLLPIGEGFTGTRATVAKMAARAREAAQDATVRAAALYIIGPTTSPAVAANAIRKFLARNVLFQADPVGHEMLRAPRVMLSEISLEGVAFGDCDDVATLGAALGLAVGMRAVMVIIAFSRTGPFEHVYTELQSTAGGPLYELDTTRPVQYPADYLAARRVTFDV